MTDQQTPPLTAQTDDSEFEELHLPELEEDELDETPKDEAGAFFQLPGFPFSRIHNQSLSFKDPKQSMLLPGKGIYLKLIDIERNPATHILNPNLYIFQVRHGTYEWIIKKRYKHFQHLHQQLRLFRAAMVLPLPTKRHKQKRRDYQSCDEQERVLPKFPKKPEPMVPQHLMQKRGEQLEQYLGNLLRASMYRNHPEMLHFLEISPLSFVHGLGGKGKECLVKKRCGGHQVKQGCIHMRGCFYDLCGRWRSRWLVAKDTFICYLNPKDGTVKSVLLMDQGFQVDHGLVDTGVHHGILLSNLTRNLVVKCWTRRKAREWAQFLSDKAKTTARDFIHPNRYDSYAPIRHNSSCRWFIDGSSAFEALADVLEKAQEEIFIADWMLSPEIYMKRPVIQGETWRLDKILLRKAEQGVKVFILLYKEVELALGINSFYSKQRLMKHPNVKVLRHPDHVAGGVFLWAHHEKIAIIDQTYAFVGGIDLCFGRWDDPHHRLTDVGGVVLDIKNGGLQTSTNIQGTNLTRTQSSSEIDASQPPPTLSKLIMPQIPMILSMKSDSQTSPKSDGGDPDVIVPIVIKTEKPESPSSPNETKSDNDLKDEKSDATDGAVKSKPGMVNAKLRARRVMQAVGKFQALKTQARRGSLDSLDLEKTDNDQNKSNSMEMSKPSSEQLLDDLGVQGSAKLWYGKDYVNFIVKDFIELDNPYADLVDRNITPRMPWHDIGMMVQGAAARDLARHFIQRWNAVKLEKAKYHPRYPWLLPKSYDDISTVPLMSFTSINPQFTADVQMIRSVSEWSAGQKLTETSIMNACCDAIQNANHYVYIENQFFISQPEGNKFVSNGIQEALYQRIIRAHKEKTVFRVFIIIPLLPCFEGQVGESSGAAIQAITHWDYMSATRGPDSLVQRVAKETGDATPYVGFFSLRNHAMLHNNLTTELVYVHSKLLIADDKVTIISSANINDRSMIGKRDSECGAIVQDVDFEPSIMDGKPYESGKFSGSLRRTLMKEHLGLMEKDDPFVNVRDPVSDNFYKEVWMKTAALNTAIFERVFHCIPTDEVHTFAQLTEYTSSPGLAITDTEAAKQQLARIKGHLVLMPSFFLCEENLLPATGTKEALAPMALWT